MLMTPAWQMWRILLFSSSQCAPFGAGEITTASATWCTSPATPEPGASFTSLAATAAGDAGGVAIFDYGGRTSWWGHWLDRRGLLGDGGFEGISGTIEMLLLLLLLLLLRIGARFDELGVSIPFAATGVASPTILAATTILPLSKRSALFLT